MIANGVRDLLRLAGVERIRAAHVPLELGELTDHERDEVELAEVGRAKGELHLIGRHAERRGDLRRELLHPRDLLAHRAETVVEDDALELVDAVLGLRLLVLFEEEARVGEACTHDAVVALRDARGVVRRVHHREVVGEQGVRVLLHAEVLLVAASDRADHRGGEREVLLLEGTRDDVRLLDE